MKILSWNINGIRAVIKKGFLDFLEKEKPDVLCLQEIKIGDIMRAKEGFDENTFLGYKTFWNSAKRPGYSGTATLIKNKIYDSIISPQSNQTKNGLDVIDFDIEGRTQIIEFKDFYLVNNYYPNANGELSRLPYKLKFNEILLKKAKKLEKKKPIIITGDYNVAHNEIDLARPKANIGSPGFTYEEREAMTKFLNSGFIDTFRHFHPQERKYSWWSYRAAARTRNVGWRLDYFCVSDDIINNIEKAFILNKALGSDHCPVGIKICF
ncbi:exodeoxyribonuclease III [Candidatus Parcubacteria bacterium]|nr:exodeoxyribonuclease III [Candidatus Parcubacteria bacterium]